MNTKWYFGIPFAFLNAINHGPTQTGSQGKHWAKGAWYKVREDYRDKCLRFPPIGGLSWITFIWKVIQKK